MTKLTLNPPTNSANFRGGKARRGFTNLYDKNTNYDFRCFIYFEEFLYNDIESKRAIFEEYGM